MFVRAYVCARVGLLMRPNVIVLLVWTTSWTPALGALFVCVCVCVCVCGVVWCGVVWCGVVWCGVVWCGVVWCGAVRCGVVWCGVRACVRACQRVS